MTSKNESAQSGGIGVCGLMFIVFLTLKLVGISDVTNWSWWWVTAPLWLPLAIVLGIIGIICLITGVIAMAAK